jgi:hypothetical protein
MRGLHLAGCWVRGPEPQCVTRVCDAVSSSQAWHCPALPLWQQRQPPACISVSGVSVCGWGGGCPLVATNHPGWDSLQVAGTYCCQYKLF